MNSTARPLRLQDQVKAVIRTRHYSRRTEKSYWYWIRYFIRFHGLRHPSTMGTREVQEFLTWLAVKRNVAAATQNQALNALVFLYGKVLERPIGDIGDTVRVEHPPRLPVVLSRDEAMVVFTAAVCPRPQYPSASTSVQWVVSVRQEPPLRELSRGTIALVLHPINPCAALIRIAATEEKHTRMQLRHRRAQGPAAAEVDIGTGGSRLCECTFQPAAVVQIAAAFGVFASSEHQRVFVQKGGVVIICVGVHRAAEILRNTPAAGILFRNIQVLSAETGMAIGTEHETAVRKRRGRPFVAGRVDRRADVDRVTPPIAARGYEPDVIATLAARPVGKEIDA